MKAGQEFLHKTRQDPLSDHVNASLHHFGVLPKQRCRVVKVKGQMTFFVEVFRIANKIVNSDVIEYFHIDDKDLTVGEVLNDD